MKKHTEKKIQEKLQSLSYPHSEAAWQKLAESMEGEAIAVADKATTPHASRKRRRLLWLLLLLLFSGIMAWGYQHYGFTLSSLASKQYLGYFPVDQLQSVKSEEEKSYRLIANAKAAQKLEKNDANKALPLAPVKQPLMKTVTLGRNSKTKSYPKHKPVTPAIPNIPSTEETTTPSASSSASKNQPTAFQLTQIPRLTPDSITSTTRDTTVEHYRIKPLDHRHNALYLEALGAGSFASLKYERRLSNKWYGTAGIGYTSENNQYAWTIPFGLQRQWALFPKRNIGLQAGLEMAYVHPFTSRLNDQQATTPYFLYYPNIGIRQASKNNLIWKINVGAVINAPQDAIMPWLGVGIGRRF